MYHVNLSFDEIVLLDCAVSDVIERCIRMIDSDDDDYWIRKLARLESLVSVLESASHD